MEIPKHIKFLSVLLFLNAAIAILIGGLTFLSPIFSTSSKGENIPDFSGGASAIWANFGLTFLVTVLASILLVFLGISLRKLKPWARTVTLAFCIVSILMSLLELVSGDQNFSYQTLVQVYAIWVLSRPDMKILFASKQADAEHPISIPKDF